MFTVKPTKRRLHRMIRWPSKSPRYFTRKRRNKLRRGRRCRTPKPSLVILSIEHRTDAATGLPFLLTRFGDGRERVDLVFGCGNEKSGYVAEAMNKL